MLKKLDDNKKRLIGINNLFSAIYNYQFNGEYIHVSLIRCIRIFRKIGFTNFENFEEIVKNKYGYSENKNDLEYKYVKILAIIHIYGLYWFYNWKQIPLYSRDNAQKDFKEFQNYLKTQEKRHKNYFPEFKIVNEEKYEKQLEKINDSFADFDLIEVLPNYIPTSKEIYYNNLKSVPAEQAEPIKVLLNPNLKSNLELAGAISEVYKQFEKIKLDKVLENQSRLLYKIDKKIYDNALAQIRELSNKVARHENDTILTIKNISVLVGCNATLLHKLLNTKN